jgi:hypothetical protein
MTIAQRRVLIVAGAVALLMLLFPPWETPGGRYLGHAWITSAPGPDDPRPAELRQVLPPPEPTSQVSLSLLALQYLALWLAAGAVFFLGASRRPADGRPGGGA